MDSRLALRTGHRGEAPLEQPANPRANVREESLGQRSDVGAPEICRHQPTFERNLASADRAGRGIGVWPVRNQLLQVGSVHIDLPLEVRGVAGTGDLDPRGAGAQGPHHVGRPRGRLAVSQVDVPAERLNPGPTGYRVKVIDFDGDSNVLYPSQSYAQDAEAATLDPFAPPDPKKASRAAWKAYEKRILGDPQFHAQNVYVIAMRVLAIFERALGRRVEWGFGGHQLHIAPHAIAEANAFYSGEDQSLMFGYFTGKSGETVFTSLSHDIVAHETTHALLDGMRRSYVDPSIPEQAAFHEGFADVVALLSVFALHETTQACLLANGAEKRMGNVNLIAGSLVTREALKDSLLLGLGKQFGRELRGMRGDVLRRSVDETPAQLLKEAAREPHRLGEVFAAAMLNALLDLWDKRIQALGTFGRGYRNLDSVVDEGSKVAEHLLTIAIRALDYCPAVDLSFCAYLASLLTADFEVSPDDSRFGYRDTIRKSFARYGIASPSKDVDPSTGQWSPFEETVAYSRSHFESMLRDKEEVFRFVWENRNVLGVNGRGFTRVNFVRPATRVGPGGLLLRETVAEYVQEARIFGAEVEQCWAARGRRACPRGNPSRPMAAAHSCSTSMAG
jgi:hypothetical protein